MRAHGPAGHALSVLWAPPSHALVGQASQATCECILTLPSPLPSPPPPAVCAHTGLPLTKSVSMSYEMQNMFPYNAGIMLANLPYMRLNYKVGRRVGWGWGCCCTTLAPARPPASRGAHMATPDVVICCVPGRGMLPARRTAHAHQPHAATAAGAAAAPSSAQDFIAMMLDNNNGMYYPNYGPGDQGIINKVSRQA